MPENGLHWSKSAEFYKKTQTLAPGGVHSPVRSFRGVGGNPVFISHADGTCLFDVDGNRYIDFCMSWGPLILGHRPPTVVAAVHSAIEKGWSYGTTEPYSLKLAQLILEDLPAAVPLLKGWFEKIRFVNSGTEAVMTALRVARAATGRDKIIKFSGCYHGHSDALLVKAGSGLTELPEADSRGLTKAILKDTLVAPLDDESALLEIFERNRGEIAAVIIEPLPANNGLLPQREEFLKFVSKLTREHGALLIFDEVISGFRMALGGMAEITGIRPDLVTYGKVIGGGFPVGAIAGPAKWMDLLAPEGAVYQAGTLSANPVAMSAGFATLQKLLQTKPYADLRAFTHNLCNAIEDLAKNSFPHPLKIQRRESLFWMIIGLQPDEDEVRNLEGIPSLHREIFPKLFWAMLRQGIYWPPSAFEVGFIATAHLNDPDSTLTLLLQKFERAFLEIKNA